MNDMTPPSGPAETARIDVSVHDTAAGVLTAIAPGSDPVRGATAVLLTTRDGALLAPLLIDGRLAGEPVVQQVEMVDGLVHLLHTAGVPACVVAFVEHGDAVRPDDEERAAHQLLVTRLAAAGVDLIDTWLVTDAGATLLPVWTRPEALAG